MTMAITDYLLRKTLAVGAALTVAIMVMGLGACSANTANDAAPERATGPKTSETYSWRPVAIGGGGFITGMSSDATGATRVVRTDVHGAYIWNVAADRWVQLANASAMRAGDRHQNGMNEGAYEITVAPGDPRRIYMAIKGRVYRSNDGGGSWDLRSGWAPFPHPFDANSAFRLYGPFMAVSPVNPDLLFLGTAADGLWRSADGARNWTRVASVPAGAGQNPPLTVRFGPVAAGGTPLIYAASPGHGVLVSGDNGQSFAPLTKPGTPQPMTVVQTSFAADGSLFAIDPGVKKAWVFRDSRWTDLGLPPAVFAGVAADPKGNRVLVSDAGGQIWCSVNGSTGWTHLYRKTSVGAKEPPYLRVNNGSYFASGQIAFDPVVADRLWVAAGTGPYYADLGPGCSPVVWKLQARGIEELVANDVIQPPGHAPLFAAWDFGIHVKPDLNAYSTTYGPKARVLISAQQMDWSPSNPAFIVTNASDARMDCCSEDGDSVLAGFSLDGGNSWQKFASLPQPPGTKPGDPWRMSFGAIAVSANSIDNIVWAPAFNRSPYYTRDRGRSWTRVVLPGEKLPFTGSFTKLYGSRKTLAADRVLPGTFYLMHSGDWQNGALAGLWRTTDGGGKWTRVFQGQVSPNSTGSAKLRAVPGKAGHLFFTSGAGYGPDTFLRRSVDGGAKWTSIEGVDHVDDVAFGKAPAGGDYPTIFVSGRVGGTYGIWRSTDDAHSWRSVAGFPMGRLDQVTVIAADPNIFGRVYVGYMGSGWLYGEPAKCTAAAFRADADRDCQAVGALAPSVKQPPH
jgi:hypothetical protein